MFAGDAAIGLDRHARARFGRSLAPRPDVAEPELGHDAQVGGVRTAVGHGNDGMDVVDIFLGIFDGHVEESVPVEDSGRLDLVFGLVAATAQPLADEVLIREGGLRITVEELQVGVARGRVEVVIDLLDVLSVVALLVGQAEEPFLQDVVPAVPQGEGQAHLRTLVADPRQPVLAPAIGARACLLMRQRTPGIAVAAVILPHRPPLALGEIRAPQGPCALAPRLLGDAAAFGPAVELAHADSPRAGPGPRASPNGHDRRATGDGWRRRGIMRQHMDSGLWAVIGPDGLWLSGSRDAPLAPSADKSPRNIPSGAVLAPRRRMGHAGVTEWCAWSAAKTGGDGRSTLLACATATTA